MVNKTPNTFCVLAVAANKTSIHRERSESINREYYWLKISKDLSSTYVYLLPCLYAYMIYKV